jgi:hypothetical protein
MKAKPSAERKPSTERKPYRRAYADQKAFLESSGQMILRLLLGHKGRGPMARLPKASSFAREIRTELTCLNP